MDGEGFGVAVLRAADLHSAASPCLIDEGGGHTLSSDATHRPTTGQPHALVAVLARRWSPVTGMRWDARAIEHYANDGRAHLGTVGRRIGGAASQMEGTDGTDRAAGPVTAVS